MKVSFTDKREFPAKVIGTDKYTDMAVIKIDQQNLPDACALSNRASRKLAMSRWRSAIRSASARP